MRVDNSKNTSVQNKETTGTKHSGRASGAQESKKSEKASVAESEHTSPHARTEISSKGKEAVVAKSVATDTPDVREDKVADLKKRIADGSYKIDSDAVADRMIDDHLKMSGIG